MSVCDEEFPSVIEHCNVVERDVGFIQASSEKRGLTWKLIFNTRFFGSTPVSGRLFRKTRSAAELILLSGVAMVFVFIVATIGSIHAAILSRELLASAAAKKSVYRGEREANKAGSVCGLTIVRHAKLIIVWSSV